MSKVTKPNKCSQAQLEALALARAAAAAKKEVKPVPDQKEELIALVKEVKEILQSQYATEMRAIDDLRVQLEDIKSKINKPVTPDYLKKFG